jgi:pimeloyl-ACP methyl ester carboxylesterase
MEFIKILFVTVVVIFSAAISSGAAQDKFELVHFKTDDGGDIEASFFKADGDHIVIFAHGAIFNKESWYILAEKLQQKGVSALPIDFRGYGNSKSGNTSQKSKDILGAIAFAKEKGFTNISIIGASMGGAAVLAALGNKVVPVSKVILLAPAGGSAIKSEAMKKLFVVSEKEGLYSRVIQIYEGSDNPKELKEFAGNAHAQHLFKTNNAKELEKLMIDFIIFNN